MSNVVPISRDPLSAVHRSLRAATQSDHLRVDRLIGELDLTRREGYGRLLSIHHAVLQDLRPEWRAEDHDDFRAMSRRLQNDLRVLGFPTANPPSMLRSPPLAEGHKLGIAYVIRGSRLGYHHSSPHLIWILNRLSPGFNFLRSYKASPNPAKPESAMQQFKEPRSPSSCFRACLRKRKEHLLL
jgi:heme oxygenase